MEHNLENKFSEVIIETLKCLDTVIDVAPKNSAVVDLCNKIKPMFNDVLNGRNVSAQLDLHISMPVHTRIIPNRAGYVKRDGTVLLEIEFKQGNIRRYISSGISVPKECLDGKHIKTNDTLLYEYYRSVIKKINDNLLKLHTFFNRTFDFQSIENQIGAYKHNLGCQMSLLEFFNSNMSDENVRNSKTSNGYLTTINSFNKFLKNATISDLTIENIKSYDKYLISNGLAGNTITSKT